MTLSMEWNAGKAETNLRKHRVSFEEAATAFADPLGWIYPDPVHSDEELREILIGESTVGLLPLVCFTERHKNTIRIISSRIPTKHERRKYEAERARL